MSIKEEIKYFCLGGVIVAIIMTITIVSAIALFWGFLYLTEVSSKSIAHIVIGCAITLVYGHLFHSYGKDIKKKGFWNLITLKDGSKTQ